MAASANYEVANAHWYDMPSNQMASSLVQYVRTLSREQAWRQEYDRRHLRLYGNSPLVGYMPQAYGYNREHSSFGPRLSLNVVRTMVQAVTARVTKSKPKATFLTDHGDGNMKRKAKLLERFTDACFYETNFEQTATRAVTDAVIGGTAFVKVCSSYEDKLLAERAFFGEMIVSDRDGIYGMPRNLYQVRLIDRYTLKQMYPEYEGAISKATAATDGWWGYESGRALVETVEGWHLGIGGKPGRHILAIPGCALVNDKWTRKGFPFAVLRWQQAELGYWGTGLAEELQGIQLEINKLLSKVQEAMNLVGNPRVWVERGSKVVGAHIQNEIGGINYYTGQKPIIETAPSINPDILNQIDKLYQRAHEVARMSMLSAHGEKPAGLNAGVALETYHDIENEGFAPVMKAYEQLWIDVAKLMIEEAKDIAERTGEFKVRYRGPNWYETIDWKDVDLDEDSYIMKAFPTSALPDSPAGKLQTLTNWINLGWVTPQRAKQLADAPDLGSDLDAEQVSAELTQKHVDDILSGGTAQPVQHMNLEETVARFKSAYLEARLNDMPLEIAEALNTYTEQAAQMLLSAQIPQILPGAQGPAANQQLARPAG